VLAEGAGEGELAQPMAHMVDRASENDLMTHEQRLGLLATVGLDDAKVVVVAYGITSRVARAAVTEARKKGIPAGLLRMKTVWPFPEQKFRKLAEKVKGFVVAEINLGQIALEVERCAAGKASVAKVTHAGGTVHTPADILKALKEVVK